MKKHLFALILALLLAALASTAAAQTYYTLPEIREQAKQGWHETYADKYGHTQQVDVDIEVYGEDAAPVVKASWDSKRIDLDGPEGEAHAESYEARQKGKGENVYLYDGVSYMKVDLDKKYAEGYGNDVTLRDVYDFCDWLMKAHGRSLYEDYLWEQPSSFTVAYCKDNKTGGVLVPALYSLTVCQKEFGLPLLTHAGHSFDYMMVAFTCPYLLFNFKDPEHYAFTVSDFKVSEILAEDIPLCSVETALEGARKMIEDGYIRHITGMRFGYVVYSDPEADWSKRLSSYDVDTWYLVPAWVMECHVMWNPKEDDSGKYNSREIVINAQTGEMLNYFDTSLNGGGDVRYKGFISWDDVK